MKVMVSEITYSQAFCNNHKTQLAEQYTRFMGPWFEFLVGDPRVVLFSH